LPRVCPLGPGLVRWLWKGKNAELPLPNPAGLSKYDHVLAIGSSNLRNALPMLGLSKANLNRGPRRGKNVRLPAPNRMDFSKRTHVFVVGPLETVPITTGLTGDCGSATWRSKLLPIAAFGLLYCSNSALSWARSATRSASSLSKRIVIGPRNHIRYDSSTYVGPDLAGALATPFSEPSEGRVFPHKPLNSQT